MTASETVTATDAPAGGLGRWYDRHRDEVLLAVVVLLLAVPIVQPRMDQQVSRYALTAAIVDQGTISLDGFRHQIGVDHAIVGDRIYSDKAPGQPLWAIPAYALYRAVGGVPAAEDGALGNLGLWAVSVWSSALPAAALAVAMRRLALRAASPRAATLAALSAATATMLLPFATQLFSHVLSALLGVTAYLLLQRERAAWLVAGGLVAGGAVATEYTLGLVVVVLLGYAAWRHRGRALWFVLGGVPPAVLLALYHWAAFGHPLQLPYRFSNLGGETFGLIGVRTPAGEMLARVLVGERGMFLITPVVLVGVIGLGWLAWRRPAARGHALVGLAVFAAFVLMHAGWANPTGGWSPGPRYAVPSLPFLAAGIAVAWDRWPGAAAVATGVGLAIMLLATLTLPLAPRLEVALPWWVNRVAEGRTAMSLLTMAFGSRWWLLPPVAAAAAVAAVLVRGAGLRRGPRG